ncbi:MAG: sigma-70 family RNA polymerase sigma factor [Solirubrobacterales bacterium]|nr:sigma-70 family RNA polymerase sigma factor [Solirubrobacterales bacterium]MBV9537234.1 sigma-70 family RNA polymerase sigma factor [Solirubrobacterales bacterium]
MRSAAAGRAAGRAWSHIVQLFRSTKSPAHDLRALGDEDLMELAGGGDARAFEVVFDRHAGVAFSLAYRICGSRTRAEEVVQEAFLSLWRGGARYDRARGSVRSWVLSTTRNRAIDTLRRELASTSRDVYDERFAEQLPSPLETVQEAERRDDVRRVRSALGELPQDQRRVIELAYFGGFSHTQIADMLGLPAGTVKGRMRLGLSKLRLLLGDAPGVLG